MKDWSEPGVSGREEGVEGRRRDEDEESDE